MKKIIFIVTLLLSAFTVNAQTAIQTSKLLDNTYVGVQAGVNTPLTFNQMFPVNEYTGIRVGKNITPVLGLNIDAGVTFNDHANGHTGGLINHFSSSAVVNTINVGLNGTVNLMNLINGYKGTPRFFEVSTVTGLGWSHIYNKDAGITDISDDNELIAKTGADFALNLGKNKAWQVYAEPAVIWNLTNKAFGDTYFDKNHAYLQLLVGINYKFKTSNGTHNFKVYDVTALNNEINSLHSKLSKEVVDTVDTVDNRVKEFMETVADTTTNKAKEVVDTVTNTATNETFVVFFAQNSDELTPAAKEILDKISGTVDVTGFASPEGTSEYNLKLSERRANAVANYLKNKGVTVNTVTGLGVQDKTTNRVAIVNKK